MKRRSFLGSLFDFLDPQGSSSGSGAPSPASKKEAKPTKRPKTVAHPFEEFADELLAELCEEFPMGYVPSLKWKGLRVTAGMAYYELRMIGLSHRVLKTEDQVRRTLIHEYAHLLAVARQGVKGKGHGAAWQKAMLDLGETPEVRHNYEVERNNRKQIVLYRCSRCGAIIQKSRKFPKGRRYMHIKCGGAIVLHRTQQADPRSVTSLI